MILDRKDPKIMRIDNHIKDRGIAVKVLDKLEKGGLLLPKKYILKVKDRDSKIFEYQVSRNEYDEVKIGGNHAMYIPVSKAYDTNNNYLGDVGYL